MTRHSGKRYIVFGADGGIGQATCKNLHEAGAKLMLVGGPDKPKVGKLSAHLGDAQCLSIDATSSSNVKQAFDAAARDLGEIDGVVCCIGSFGLEPIERVSDEAIAAVIALNLGTALYIAREVAQRFKHNSKAKSVVFVTSAAAQRGMLNQEVLSAAKGGVEALVRSLASTLAPSVRVNGVAPGLIATPLTQDLRFEPNQSDISKAMFATQQFGDAEQVADVVALLLDAKQSFVTGQVWSVDGGLTTVQVKPREHVDAEEAKLQPRDEGTGGEERVSKHLERQKDFDKRTATE